MSVHCLFVHAYSSVHVGTGQSVGAIDLPIIREKSTNIPYIPGSSLKGVLRDRFENTKQNHSKMVETIFGSSPEESKETTATGSAGYAHFGDARLVFLPIRSMSGTFAYATSPLLLERLSRDLSLCGDVCDLSALFAIQSVGHVHIIPTSSALVYRIHNESRVILDEFDLKPMQSSTEVSSAFATLRERVVAPLLTWESAGGENDAKKAKKLDAEKNAFMNRVCIVHDDLMSFLLERATEVTTHIRLEAETKTVQKGALWTQEALPAETILLALVNITKRKQKIDSDGGDNEHQGERVNGILSALKAETQETVQIGGSATTGQGLCRLVMVG